MSESKSSTFRRITLDDLAISGSDSFVDGPFGSNLKSNEYVESGVRLIQLQNIGEGEWRDENQKFITHRKFKVLERHGAVPGDIAIAKMADPVARACIIPRLADQYVVVADCIRLRVDETRFEPRFIVRAINSPYTRREAEQKAIGSTRVRINLSVLKTVGCLVPSLMEQMAVAQILDTLDTAIRETEAIIAKLKAIKQGLLHDLLTRGIDANGELRPPQSEAPHLYKDSPLGWIPREWNACLVKYVLLGIEAGKSPNCQDIPAVGDDWGVLKVGAVHPDGLKLLENKVIDADHLKNSAYLVRNGDLLLSRANTFELVGLVCHVTNYPKHLMLSDKTLRLLVNPARMMTRFLFWRLQHPISRAQIEIAATGTSGSMKNISQSGVENLWIAHLSPTEQSEITKQLDASSKRYVSELEKLAKLTELKTGLMDDLLTGRVRVTPLLAGESAGT